MGFAEGVRAVPSSTGAPMGGGCGAADAQRWLRRGEGEPGAAAPAPRLPGKTTPAGSYLCLEDQVAEVVTKSGVRLPRAHS